jgi:hypothetical protein
MGSPQTNPRITRIYFGASDASRALPFSCHFIGIYGAKPRQKRSIKGSILIIDNSRNASQSIRFNNRNPT